MYETACLECKSGEKLLAVYVGESVRSGSERMTEHLENVRDRRAQSDSLLSSVYHGLKYVLRFNLM